MITSHGEVKTPALVAVATQATVKTLTSEEAIAAGCQMLICNTFHLNMRPGGKIIRQNGGLHKFMNWPRPLMTDSGGFQVFSLGFGYDFGVGKLIKYFPGQKQPEKTIGELDQPSLVKIKDEGVFFRSRIDGREVFIGPKESMLIQRDLGADIIFAFDECTPPTASREYVAKSLDRTHRWAGKCLKYRGGNQAIFGIIQGSRFKDLREKSARFINSLGFEGYGIGGDLGTDKKTTKKILRWTTAYLDAAKPRHLLGIGYPEDIEMMVKEGIDLFDCVVPTHYARRGIAFTAEGKINFNKISLLKDKRPLDSQCDCQTCQSYKRSYIAHLIRAKEITGMRLLTFHNLYFFNFFVEKIRDKIKNGQL